MFNLFKHSGSLPEPKRVRNNRVTGIRETVAAVVNEINEKRLQPMNFEQRNMYSTINVNTKFEKKSAEK